MFQIKADSYETLSRRAAEIVLAELREKPDLLLCASAGGTPTGAYGRLSTRFLQQPRLFKKLRVLAIDEWAGLPRGHPASCESDLGKKLVEPLRIGVKRFTCFGTGAVDPARECDRVGRWLKDRGPIDLCILGLGTNGHVAMNEPAMTLPLHPHVVKLARSSLKHSMLAEVRPKPRRGMTLGMGDILSSRKILLLVNGCHKRNALHRLFRAEITTRFPASLLWLHPDVTVLFDREAAPTRNSSHDFER